MQIKLVVGLEEFATCVAYKWLGYPCPRISFVAAVSSRTNAGSRHIADTSFRSSIKFIPYSTHLGTRYSFHNKTDTMFLLLTCICFYGPRRYTCRNATRLCISSHTQVADLLERFWSVAQRSKGGDGCTSRGRLHYLGNRWQQCHGDCSF